MGHKRLWGAFAQKDKPIKRCQAYRRASDVKSVTLFIDPVILGEREKGMALKNRRMETLSMKNKPNRESFLSGTQQKLYL